MKILMALFTLFMATAYAKPILVLSAFDTFGTAPFNNSQRVAETLMQELKLTPDFPVDVRFCLLPTVYDVGEEVLSKCVSEVQGQELIGVISLGEAFCNIKIETMATNYDKNQGRGASPDNRGEFRNAPIINGGAQRLGFTLPLDELYCSLSQEEKKHSIVSVDTGNFVCNNTAYLFKHNYPDTPFTFMHLAANNCKNLESVNPVAISIIKKLILKTLESYEKRLTHAYPLTKNEAKEMMKNTSGCYNEFYKEMKKAL